jgi:hypothetical protein
MNLFVAIDYLLHRLSAKNRHGLHSPYIYKLLDEIVYDFADRPQYAEAESLTRILPPDHNRANSQKLNRLLYRLLQYFKPQTLAIADNLNTITTLYLQQAAPNALQIPWDKLPQQPADVMVCDATKLKLAPDTFKPGAILIVTNIYADAAARAFWQRVKQQPNLNVTVDFFWLGLAFNRPEQAGEDFKLRF